MYGSNGWHGGQVRPHAIYFGAGGSLFVRPISWRYWRQSAAYGRGTRWANNCVPDCARGAFSKLPASLMIWRVRWHNHRRYFSRMTVRWTTRDGAHHMYVYRWGILDGGTVPFWH
jgi:hypothetical protein